MSGARLRSFDGLAAQGKPPGPIAKKTIKSFETVDTMTPSLRACVHEFGLPIVQALMDNGIKSPQRIRHLVLEIWNGARQHGQRTGFRSPASPVMAKLDWLLIQNQAGISAATLLRVLASSDMVIVPREPSGAMIHASMAEVDRTMAPLTKPEKHRRRLRAAVMAGARKLWPVLNDGAAE